MNKTGTAAGPAFDVELTGNPLSKDERAERMISPGFGRVLSEHIVSARWSAGTGWHDCRLLPYQPIEMDPAMAGLHYGQVIFEGLKAYRLKNGSIGIFRPYAHARRFRRSARRLVMPEMDEEVFVQAITKLVRADRNWVPDDASQSLYLRPIMYATDACLALRPSAEYRFLLMSFVAEGFFNNDLTPVTVWVSTQYSRAARGGTGDVKVPGNYAGAFAAQMQAAQHGCDQVVWLDSAEGRWVEELGGMNLFFVHGVGPGARVSTPPLTGTLLPGVTRDTLLTLIPGLGLPVCEAPISVGQWRECCANGDITEVFACGTAAGITAVGTVRSAAGDWLVGGGSPGPVTRRLAGLLAGVQHGELSEQHGWLYVLD
jgi:branched-chain amino acid aminotransferase